MTTVFSDSARAKTVREVDELLEILQGELDSAKNPHRVALRSLGVDTYGWSARPFSDEAFGIWGEQLRRDPHDLETIHHLAIMHHARAIDRESTSKPRESDADWKKAMGYWTRLWREDRFWGGIAMTACKGTKQDAVDTLRQRLPRRLLRIHFDIAFDDSTRKEFPHRSAFHIDLARFADFPKEHLAAVQHEVYAEHSRAVPDAAWRSHELDPKVIEEGARVILGFLDLVPDCLPALEDAVRLQVRMLSAWYTDFQAVGQEDERQRKRLLSEFQSTAKQWRPHFDRLAERRDEADESARTGLCHWYRIAADIHRALDLPDDAEKLYALGLEAGNLDDEDLNRCSRGLGEVRALSARERAAARATDARVRCDRARDTDGLSPLGHLVLAQAYLSIHDFKQAEDVCDKGLNREPDGIDLDDFDDYQDTQQRIQELRGMIEQRRREHVAQPHIEEAERNLAKQQFNEAIGALNQALTANPESAQALFMRCQCFMALDHITDARRDLDQFRRCAIAAGSEEGVHAADTLDTQQLKPQEEQLAKFGEAGYRKRLAAIQHANKEEFEVAANLLREAMTTAPKAGAAQIQKELATVLTNWSISDVNAITTGQAGAVGDQMRTVEAVIRRMEEAVQMDRGRAETLAQVRQIQDAVRQHEQLLQEYGSKKAFDLRQKAIMAWNSDRFDEGLDLLRRAHEESKLALGWRGAPYSLSNELADMLTGVAARRVNALQDPKRGFVAKRVEPTEVLREAEKLLEEATRLCPDNANASQGLNTVRAMLRSIRGY